MVHDVLAEQEDYVKIAKFEKFVLALFLKVHGSWCPSWTGRLQYVKIAKFQKFVLVLYYFWKFMVHDVLAEQEDYVSTVIFEKFVPF